MTLSATIHLLGDLLGEVIAAQESPDLFAIEERIRGAAKARREGDPAAEDALQAAVAALSTDQARAVAISAPSSADRFAAGVMFVGISDSISKCGTTDIPEEMFLVHHRKRLWDDWDYFLKSSPIYHADKHKTPLLILHGKADPRVHPSQSLELHRNLKIRGQAPVRLVLYPGEGHGNRRAASRLDYNLRMLQWMEHYLKGPGGAPPPYELDYGLGGATKTSALGQGWRDLPLRLQASGLESATASPHWLGGKCPCCIGW